MNRFIITSLVAAIGLTFIGANDDGCDSPATPENKKDSDKPSAAKIAGWEPGEVRVCALTGSNNGSDALTTKAALGDESMHDFEIKKSDKGYCEYLRPDWHRYGFSFLLSMTPPDGTSFTEVGVYYMTDAKDNPSFDDFKYTKASKNKDGVWNLRFTPDVDMPTVKFTSP